MIDEPDYEAAEIDAWRKNYQEILEDPLLRLDVVKKDAERRGFEPEIFLYEYMTNSAFSMQYTKEPSKQTLHQRTAADWIRTVEGVKNFMVLPSKKSDGALYVTSGMIVSGAQLVNDDHPKSIDFYWEIETNSGRLLKFYATHKYTKEAGGAQDNQFNDLKIFAVEARKLTIDNGIRLLVLCDGNYYVNPNKSGETKLSVLESICNGRYARAMKCRSIPSYIASCIELE